jgi:hypothetical protein
MIKILTIKDPALLLYIDVLSPPALPSRTPRARVK